MPGYIDSDLLTIKPHAGAENQSSRLSRTQDSEGFGKVLNGLLEKVDDMHRHADSEAVRLADGEGNIHEAAIAIEQAEIALQLMGSVRNKVIEAYQTIMRMPV